MCQPSKWDKNIAYHDKQVVCNLYPSSKTTWNYSQPFGFWYSTLFHSKWLRLDVSVFSICLGMCHHLAKLGLEYGILNVLLCKEAFWEWFTLIQTWWLENIWKKQVKGLERLKWYWFSWMMELGANHWCKIVVLPMPRELSIADMINQEK